MKRVGLALFLTVVASAQTPSVNTGGVRNHFSLLSPLLPGGNIAQGSVFRIDGKNLGPEEGAISPDLPVLTLAGVSVQVTVGGVSVDALLIAVSESRLVAVLPSATRLGTGTLVVSVNGQKSAPAAITVVKTSVGIRTVSALAAGPAVLEMRDENGGVTPNSLTEGIKPLQIGILHGTGLGPVAFSELAGAPEQPLDADIHVFVAGLEAKVLFQGRTPGQVGFDEFRIEIPEGVPAGCYVPVGIQFGSNMSNYVSISVGPDGGACPDPRLPLDEATKILQAQGIVRTGAIELLRTASKTPAPAPFGTIDSTIDLAAAAFISTDYSKLVATESLPSTIIGPCSIQILGQNQPAGNGSAATVLDAGTVFTVRGPNGVKQLEKNPAGYSSIVGGGTLLGGNPIPGSPVLPPFVSPGRYTFDNGAGGADVGPLTATFEVPEHLVWKEADTLKSIDRGSGVDISWTGGHPDADVFIGGGSQLPRNLSPTPAGAQFTCRAKVRDGHLTIPPVVLLSLPPTVNANGAPSGTLQVTMTPATEAFHAPGVDIGILGFSHSTVRAMEFK